MALPSSSHALASVAPSSVNGAVKTCFELDHVIGFNSHASYPLHYLNSSVPTNPQNEEKQNDPIKSTAPNFVYVSGSSLTLAQFGSIHSQSFLKGHKSPINAATVSKDRTLLASVESGSTPDVCVWNANGKLLYRLEEHGKGVSVLAFSSDSRFLATVGNKFDRKLYIWDMQTGYIVTSETIQPLPCVDFKWGGRVKDRKRRPTTDYLFASCGNGEVRIWALNPQTGRLLSERCNNGNLQRDFTCLCFSPTNDLVIAGTTSGDFLIFNVRQLSRIALYGGCGGGVTTVSCQWMLNLPSNVERLLNSYMYIRIIMAGGDATLSEWTYDDDQEKFFNTGQMVLESAAMVMDINSDQSQMLIGTSEGSISTLSGFQKDVKPSVEFHSEISPVMDVKFSVKSSDFFITLSQNGNLKTWNTSNYSIALRHNSVATLPPQQQTLIVGNSSHSHSNSSSSHSNSASGNPFQINMNADSTGRKCNANCMDMNEEIIVCGWNNGDITSYNAITDNEYLWTIKDTHKGGVSVVALSLNEKYILSGGQSGTLRLWDLRHRSLIMHLKEHKLGVNGLALYDDCRYALSASKDRSFVCWDLAGQRRVSSHRKQMGGMNDITLTPNQQNVITVGSDKSITFWDIREPNPINAIKNAHNSEINKVKISPNGNLMATAGDDHIIKLWDLKTNKLLDSHSSHLSGINKVIFSGDNRHIVSVGNDANIVLWNVFSL